MQITIHVVQAIDGSFDAFIEDPDSPLFPPEVEAWGPTAHDAVVKLFDLIDVDAAYAKEENT